MADCVYCHKPAGLFRKAHKDCENNFKIGSEYVRSIVANAIADGRDLSELASQVSDTSTSRHIDEISQRALLVDAWGNAVETFLDEDPSNEAVPEYLNDMRKHFDLSQQELDVSGAYSRMLKWAVIQDLLEGTIPDRLDIIGALPFNFQKNEVLVWLFQDVPYYERKTVTRYVGRSHGVSVRVAKGLYVRSGAFRGQPVKTDQVIHVDTGMVGITTKHIYFAGSTKSFRVNYGKIVSFEPYSDAIGIQRDAQTAKPQIFVTGDGWFTYNLVVNLAQR